MHENVLGIDLREIILQEPCHVHRTNVLGPLEEGGPFFNQQVTKNLPSAVLNHVLWAAVVAQNRLPSAEKTLCSFEARV
jgi:hypothetical protein